VLEGLNEPQREAVLYGDGPLVVFAGAGSGKTRVITHRVAHLITERDVAPWRILAVTFTNKAAGEMRERLGQLVPGGSRGLVVGTFHAMCARLLRKHSQRIGIRRDFTIYDDADQKALLKRVMRDLDVDAKRFPPRQISSTIQRAKQEMQEVADRDDLSGYYRDIAAKIADEYEERKEKAGALDFGDLIYRLVLALEADDELREEVSGRFRHILVDEFQDTNHSQLRLVHALASVHGNLTVVGDDDQSIYRWRGADRRNILDFRKSYPSAHIVKLEQNYRSSARILRAAHAVIRRNTDREPKELWTEKDAGERVFVVGTDDERQEAQLVVRGVEELRAKGESLDSIAVLYRINAQSRVIEERLLAEDIPYRVVGGVRFYDRAEVKDLLAYLRVLMNPADDVSLLRIINKPTRGIGKTTLSRLLDLAAEKGVGVWDAMALAHRDGRFSKGVLRKLDAFRKLMEKLQERADLPLPDLGGLVLDETGYLAMLRAENTPESDARQQNLAELVGSMGEFEARHEGSTLTSFLEEVTLQSAIDAADMEEERVTLMTVHSAKGLEFPTIMVTGMEEGMFPFARQGNMGEDPEELAEERRLAYVAYTRAEDRLILSYARMRRIFNRVEIGTPSRFVLDLPEEDITWIGDQPTRARRRRSAPAFRADPWDAPPPPKPKRRPRDVDSYIDYSEGSDLGLVEGTRVWHPKFGHGRVTDIRHGMVPPRVAVLFDDGRTKVIQSDRLEPG
jgi:DNA helicase-2/ATP-dependent DNA helicase PcrA